MYCQFVRSIMIQNGNIIIDMTDGNNDDRKYKRTFMPELSQIYRKNGIYGVIRSVAKNIQNDYWKLVEGNRFTDILITAKQELDSIQQAIDTECYSEYMAKRVTAYLLNQSFPVKQNLEKARLSATKEITKKHNVCL